MNYKKVFRFYLQICNRTLKMLSNLLLINCLARLQMLGFICNHLQPSATAVSVSAMLVDTLSKNIAQFFILERYFFVSIYPAAIPGTYLMVFLVAALLLCL